MRIGNRPSLTRENNFIGACFPHLSCVIHSVIHINFWKICLSFTHQSSQSLCPGHLFGSIASLFRPLLPLQSIPNPAGHPFPLITVTATPPPFAALFPLMTLLAPSPPPKKVYWEIIELSNLLCLGSKEIDNQKDLDEFL